ncbi:MAG TPA: apolipoprotein N-acyltransferase [Rhizomicrobium sp.]|nr:apolipoprotein N-acyltransferase [Rhizomicrobium sp.]
MGEFFRTLQGWRRLLAALVAGGLSAFGFAPFGVFPLFLFGIAVLVLLLDGVAASPRPMRNAALTGFAYGFAQFLIGLYWVGYAFTVDAANHAWQIPFVETLLPGILALFIALACAVAVRFWRNDATRIFTFAVCYSIAEWLRGHMFTGFPWNLPAYSWGLSLPIMQSASIFGAYGLSLLTVLFGASLAELSVKPRIRIALPVSMLSLFIVLWIGGALRLANTHIADVPGVRLRIVQPDIPEKEKFGRLYMERNWQRLVMLSIRKNGWEPTHIIWPESAPPFLLDHSPAALDDIVFLTGTKSVLLTGAARMTQALDGDRQFYNSLYIFGHGGALEGTYDKFHLVPFGEYLPLEDFFHSVGIDKVVNSPGGFTPGPGPRTFSVPGAPKVGPLICYEVIFPGQVVSGDRPGWLVNVTNDSWFGNGAGPYQHFLIARMRAIEEGLPIARDAGTGISAVIDPLGRVKAQLPLNQMGILDANLPVAIAPTFYSRFGNSVFALMLLAAMVLPIFAALRNDAPR